MAGTQNHMIFLPLAFAVNVMRYAYVTRFQAEMAKIATVFETIPD